MNTNLPLVSIIIPTYNRAHLIGETLDSVLAQTYTNWECIVVDDGSTDGTDKLIIAYCEKDARLQYFKREILPKGASHCRNIGLEKASGEYCMFLDSDDLLLDFCIENRLDNIKLFPDNFFWVFPMIKKNNKNELLVCKIPKKISYLEDFLSCKIHWQTMCTLWEIKFLKSIRGFNVLYPRLNDPEIHIKAMLNANSNYIVFNDAQPDSIYRESEIKDKMAYGLNYFKSLQLFIPDVAKKLIEKNRKEDIVFLRHYLNHYYQNFQVHTKKKNMLTLLRVFYKNRILSLVDYVYLYISYLLLLLLNLSSSKIKSKINSLLKQR